MQGMKTHPHADAAYRVLPISEGGFAVEVAVPDCPPALVSSFPTEAVAEEWIARKKERVAAESSAGKWFRRSDRGNGFRR
jgi:hypothetical protein